eukprot:TRINITY_DN43200_c0_g1_i2.p1 TRINITY_DN43200_c0_g1~~TRINITY_DN43200_c0_g1_i2.p1  ORF type:complete len:382 (+),score=19.70 TRINITY_DN43200_c0_g1_i2:76-1146(+)
MAVADSRPGVNRPWLADLIWPGIGDDWDTALQNQFTYNPPPVGLNVPAEPPEWVLERLWEQAEEFLEDESPTAEDIRRVIVRCWTRDMNQHDRLWSHWIVLSTEQQLEREELEDREETKYRKLFREQDDARDRLVQEAGTMLLAVGIDPTTVLRSTSNLSRPPDPFPWPQYRWPWWCYAGNLRDAMRGNYMPQHVVLPRWCYSQDTFEMHNGVINGLNGRPRASPVTGHAPGGPSGGGVSATRSGSDFTPPLPGGLTRNVVPIAPPELSPRICPASVAAAADAVPEWRPEKSCRTPCLAGEHVVALIDGKWMKAIVTFADGFLVKVRAWPPSTATAELDWTEGTLKVASYALHAEL